MSGPEESSGGAGRRLTRKDFLVALPLGAIAAGFGLRGRAGAASQAGLGAGSSLGVGLASKAGVGGLPHGHPIGVQLYTLRSVMGDDMEGTLDALAEMGYTEVEFAGLWGRTAAEMRAIIDGFGLQAASSHHGLNQVRDGWDSTLEDAITLGQKWVVVPSINGDERTREGLLAVADDFNAAGEAARAAGLGFGYHNHSWEFEPLADGTIPYDLLLERCDPDLVKMQLDLFWAIHAGADPLQYFGAYPGRFTSVHVKGRTADGDMVAVGQGVVDWVGLFARSEQAGIEHYFVEHDSPGDDPVGNVRISFEALHGILG